MSILNLLSTAYRRIPRRTKRWIARVAGRPRGSRHRCDEASVIHNVRDPWTVDSRDSNRRRSGERAAGRDVERERETKGRWEKRARGIKRREKSSLDLPSSFSLPRTFGRPSGRAKRVPSFFSRWIVIRIQGRSGECSRPVRVEYRAPNTDRLTEILINE